MTNPARRAVGRPTHSDDGTKATRKLPGRYTVDELKTITAHAARHGHTGPHGAARYLRGVLTGLALLEPPEAPETAQE